MSFPTTPQRASSASTPLAAAATEQGPPRFDYQVFDIIAPLHELLCRLAATPGAAAADLPSVQMPFPNQQPLEIQQLASEVSSIRSRIRRARAVVEALPDVERDVEEQLLEMDWLRRRIAEQREVLRSMAEG